MPDVSVLNVNLYGETIGTLTYVGDERSIFAFNERYVDNTQRPTLSLSFKDSFGNLITDLPPTRRRVAPFFANLLPEGPLRTYLAEHAGVHEEREFYLLWALGRDLPGALTITPADGEAWPPEAAEGRARRSDRANALRFSLAGVQLKFSALKHEGRNAGLTIPAHGVGGSWIVKLPSQRFEGVPENEFAMMTLARHVGIDVPEFNLVDVDAIDGMPEGIGTLKGQAFAIKRFDRVEDGPVHIEDFAQVFGAWPDDKYKGSLRNIAYVLGVESDQRSADELVRRIVFNVLIGNADMHLKNWSLIYPDRRTPLLSPAYDLVSTIAYLPDDNFALRFARKKRFEDFTTDELKRLVSKAGLPEHPAIAVAKDTVDRFLSTWEMEKDHLPLTAVAVAAVDGHLQALPIKNVQRDSDGRR